MPFAKPPTFVVRSADPLCGGPTLDRLVAHAVTPLPDLFVRNHAAVPEIDSDAFRLRIDGLVGRSLELSLADLGAEFERREAIVTIQCAGNRRDELIAVQPIPGEVPWGAEAIGTGRWSGFALADVLRAAGVDDAADLHVAFEGLDRVERHGLVFGFGSSIALERALAGDVLLADRLDGAPLPPVHGGPLRVVIPGYIGARSVKWLGRITVQPISSENYFEAHAYKVLRRDVDPASADWAAYPPIEEAPLHAVIATVALAEATGPDRALEVVGYATGRGLHPVSRVELSVEGADLADQQGASRLARGREPDDASRTWIAADLLDDPAPGRWVRWRARVTIGPGAVAVVARASDTSGVPQPSHPRDRWNPKGYSNDAWHRVAIGSLLTAAASADGSSSEALEPA